ncbi:core trichothecene cluster (CTC) protein 15 [Colletotrichum spaethianum]|uniref:Core trichothecene cluster (CTC) protein 15 n=1 Tax=Colletotrichum spaethianum TaxID=700344 RepID=A0AA37LEZ4_9PEZI|nr:core trichothecene cluster (CTC) protein 15 [Colletotrichum spaethianum]GKT45345.1 core trichothecene cluster (CTC) protein 15 [Colletotrichum spaethianum]
MELSNSSHFKLSATSCGACAVHFDNAETRRAHSKSQWHVTNLKRRIAELDPLTADQHAALSKPPTAPVDGSTAESESENSSSSVSDAEISDADPDDDFVPEKCLFCNATSGSFDGNVAHMGKAHGMFIPGQEKLIVDLETLVRYLHLVVFGYQECLQCGTQRRTASAVQQHMLGKGHCKFDITAEDSEFKDFYEDLTEDGDGETQVQEDDMKKAISDAVEEGGSIRLPSGKTLSHRSTPAPSRQRAKAKTAADSGSDNLLTAGPNFDESDASFRLTAPSASGKQQVDTKALTRSEKRDAVFETQLSRLSLNDRAALAHLPSAEQRNVLLTQKKQLDKAEKAVRRLQTRLEMKANKTGQGNFVNDVPGRQNG